MSAHAISDHVIRTARAALSTAARNAHGLKSAAYSALLASLLYEEANNELRRTQADEVDKQNILAKAIDRCRQAAGSSAEDAVNVLRAVLELLETGIPPQVDVTPQERRAQLRVLPAASRRHRNLSFRLRKPNCGILVDSPEGAPVIPPSAFRMAYQPSPPS